MHQQAESVHVPHDQLVTDVPATTSSSSSKSQPQHVVLHQPLSVCAKALAVSDLTLYQLMGLDKRNTYHLQRALVIIHHSVIQPTTICPSQGTENLLSAAHCP